LKIAPAGRLLAVRVSAWPLSGSVAVTAKLTGCPAVTDCVFPGHGQRGRPVDDGDRDRPGIGNSDRYSVVGDGEADRAAPGLRPGGRPGELPARPSRIAD
jgi:hypothetical protein